MRGIAKQAKVVLKTARLRFMVFGLTVSMTTSHPQQPFKVKVGMETWEGTCGGAPLPPTHPWRGVSVLKGIALLFHSGAGGGIQSPHLPGQRASASLPSGRLSGTRGGRLWGAA